MLILYLLPEVIKADNSLWLYYHLIFLILYAAVYYSVLIALKKFLIIDFDDRGVVFCMQVPLYLLSII